MTASNGATRRHWHVEKYLKPDPGHTHRRLKPCSAQQGSMDASKAATNLRKHGVSFDLAPRVFADPCAMKAQDRYESGEYRGQTLGLVEGILLVAHTVGEEADGSEVIRIISARRAEPKERKHHERNCH